jgi:hypothetical protein
VTVSDTLHEVPALDGLCGKHEEQDDGSEHQQVKPWRVHRVAVQRRVEEVDEVRERGEGGCGPVNN